MKFLLNNLISILRTLYLIQLRPFEIEIKFLKKFYKNKKNLICFDVGCCHGSYAKILKKFSSRIYCFEPEKKNFNYLKDIFKFEKKIKLFNFAISDQNSHKILYTPDIIRHSTPNSTLNKQNIKIKNFNIQKVRTVTLDTFVKKNNINKLDFIKIDVEGHEYKVVKSSIYTLKKFSPILLIELIKKNNNNFYKIIKLLNKLNFKMYFYNRQSQKLSLVALKDFKIFQSKLNQKKKEINFFDQSYVQNFFFIKKK